MALVADNAAVGRELMSRVAMAVRLYVKDVRLIVPPAGVKDLRAWYRQGVSRAELDAVIAAAPPVGLRVASAGRIA